ncbi:hypothetical protein GCM10007918_42340 [Piscinibacter gummiphilus]|nr:hypothetical protein GCM10007918_42340 [Piscinibacter gummiphilus]
MTLRPIRAGRPRRRGRGPPAPLRETVPVRCNTEYDRSQPPGAKPCQADVIAYENDRRAAATPVSTAKNTGWWTM